MKTWQGLTVSDSLAQPYVWLRAASVWLKCNITPFKIQEELSVCILLISWLTFAFSHHPRFISMLECMHWESWYWSGHPWSYDTSRNCWSSRITRGPRSGPRLFSTSRDFTREKTSRKSYRWEKFDCFERNIRYFWITCFDWSNFGRCTSFLTNRMLCSAGDFV